MLEANDSRDLVNALRQLIEQTVRDQLEPHQPGGTGLYPPDRPGIVRTPTPELINPRDYADEANNGGTFNYSRFLHEHNPYGAESIEPTDDIEAIGPARKNDIGYPLRKSIQDLTPLEVDECPRWTFGNATYRVTKAIRIPYRYRHPNGEQDIEGSILIGFQGPGY
jgi:hypothetical protein